MSFSVISESAKTFGLETRKIRGGAALRCFRSCGELLTFVDLSFIKRSGAYRILGSMGVAGEKPLIAGSITDAEVAIPLENYPELTDRAIMDNITVRNADRFFTLLVELMNRELPKDRIEFNELLSGGGGQFGQYVRVLAMIRGCK